MLLLFGLAEPEIPDDGFTLLWQVTGGRLEEERMDQGILDNSFKQVVVEVGFSDPTLICVAELQCLMLYSNLGWSISISECINAQHCWLWQDR